ncbi:MAG: putative DNA binding domain-containing protein [Clostridiales bacterium]|jgi:ATP-dependent DNA helicase RecG|nr:putative DNA binding domain-containing protein [Clostridiales bacterium]
MGDTPGIGFQESLTIEFKSDRSRLSDNDLVDAVVAFANTDGGIIYVGVEDDGAVTGLHPEHRDMTRLSAMIANKTVPPLPIKAELLWHGQPPAAIAAIHVSKSRTIAATSSGKLLRRRLKMDGTPENVPLYPFEITTRLSGLGLLDFSAQPVPDASYSDLDPVERARLRGVIQNQNGESALLELGDEELDQALQFATRHEGVPTPTLTGMLMIGRPSRLRALTPTAETAIQIMRGTEVKFNETLTLPLLAAYERIIAHVKAWNQETELTDGLYRISVPDFDQRALREAIVNAFCHRDYSILGRVRIQIGDEGLTISNPGGFVEGVSIGNLLAAEPHGRNPALANALKRIGLAERTGRGVDRIFEGSLRYGKPMPDYSASSNVLVSVFFPRSQPDRAFTRMVADEQARTGQPLSIVSLLILNFLKGCGRRSETAHTISKGVNVSAAIISSTLEPLTQSGLIEVSGSDRNRAYSLNLPRYREFAATGAEVGTHRRKKTERPESAVPPKEQNHEDMVLRLAKKQGYVTRADAASLLRLSPPQAFRILRRLALKGSLALSGKGRYARYVPAAAPPRHK